MDDGGRAVEILHKSNLIGKSVLLASLCTCIKPRFFGGLVVKLVREGVAGGTKRGVSPPCMSWC